jgi:hypothetical protein
VRCGVREAMARDMSGSDDCDVVIVGMMDEASMESVAVGTAATATAFVVVATRISSDGVAHAPPAMMVMADAMMSSYGLLVLAMVTIGVASVIVGDQIFYTSQPATCRLARAPPALARGHDAPGHGRGVRRPGAVHRNRRLTGCPLP